MFLKRLTCQGFKSFADKTDFDFLPGATCIVGPNGCGKSNVVDAIKWVLGEQSARSLRGRQMLDVIFNGSGTRRSSGMAQVDLLFDNADRALPCDHEEVTVTRRLYRSGESEYLLNNQTCRLKDVRELFLDTGVGVDAYSIIEQGKVDVLLQANPSERRVIFEEAAGISRYKARKKEAVRKLERVEQNLLRLNDIVDEVEKRLRSVKYQAGKARSYQTYATRLRELRASFSLAEFHKYSARDAELGGLADEQSDRATALRTAVDRDEAAAAQHDAATLRLDGDIHDREQRLLTITAEITAYQERTEQSRQRMQELDESLRRAQSRLIVEQHRAAVQTQRMQEESQAAERLEAQHRERQAAIDELHAKDQTLARELAALHARLEDGKAAMIELLRRGAKLNNDIRTLEVQQGNLGEQRERLTARDAAIRAEQAERQRQRSELEARAHEIAGVLAEHTRHLAEAQEQARQLDSAMAELDRDLTAAREDRSALVSRRDLLADLERRFEGVDAGVRAVLERKRADASGATFGYVMGIVADLFATDTEWASLIEVALRDAEQCLVVADSAALLADRDTYANLPGRVRAFCLDRLGPILNDRDYSDQPGFVAYALDWVRVPEPLEHLARHLLGRAVIVKSLDDAMRLAETAPASHRFVTLDGQIVEPGGRIALGPADTQSGLISRKSELREIDRRIEVVDERIAAVTSQRAQVSADAEQLDRREQELRTAIADTRGQEIETRAALNAAIEGLRRLEHEQPLIAGEIASLDHQMRDAAERTAAYRASLASVEEENTAHEAEVTSLNADIQRLGNERASLAESLTAARVEAAQLAEKRTAAAEVVRSLRSAHDAAVQAVGQARQEADDCRHRHDQLERGVLAATSRLAELYRDKEGLSQDVLALRRRRDHLRHELERLAAAVRQHRSELQAAEASLHQFEMERQGVRVRRDELVARVRDQLGIDLVAQYETYEHAEQNWEAVETEIADLRQKIERLGNVNLDAITEQEELEKRAEFLTSQREDLTTSRRQLEELIEKLNNESRERFRTTFEQVRMHFQELYRKLFGGGKADVFLEPNEDGSEPDILEAGIEIRARPPGKELQSISLLSGGEKTMTAIALLLAIFKSRPSPFAILDEVDAALDEANNERFNRIIREFLAQSQFILITHSKRTMSVGDVLYGITMQEAGVSKRVAVKFEDASAEPRPAVA